MYYVNAAFRWVCAQILRLGNWLRSFDPADAVGFCIGLFVMCFVVWGTAKIWCIAISDTGYYDNRTGSPSFMIMRSGTIGYTICWTQEGKADFAGCVETRKR